MNPIAVWGDVLTTTLTDIGKLGQEYAADPFPILRQLIINQMSYVGETVSIVQGMANGFRYWANTVPGQLQTIGQQLATGHISDAVMTGNSLFVNAVAATFFPLLRFDIPQKMAQNFANVVKAITPVATGVGFALLSTVYEGNKALADTAQKFYDAVKSGDLVTSLSELINAPANVIGGVLNGYGTDKGIFGIFGSYGVVNAVLNGLKTIANAIKPPAPEAPVASTAGSAAVATAVTDTATKALAPATKPSATAAIKTGDIDKSSTAPAKSKESVAKEDSKAEAPSPTEAEAPATQPVKVTEPTKADTSTPAADPVSAEPAKVETTKPVQKDTTKSEPGTKATGATSSDADSAGKPDKSGKLTEKAAKAEKAQKTSKAPKVAKQPKKASATQQSANAG
ncbi:hypothetical protein ACJH6H_01595 [Mycobacterium sp. SMC-21]|uniref:hypothetical protein n=1 Tax=Mycobacteriaceae TaxID=1762 RepID=UPI001CFAA570|nr:hypothetical protein [Mycolicibacterium phocaicum]UCZ60107.1 hypothetical protein LHJ73_26185 [Mycolicibacterium phocaicum]